jgi:vitamin B12 transporter
MKLIGNNIKMINKKISISLITSLLISMNLSAEDSVQLSSITVSTATKTEQSIQDVTSAIEVITKEELEERHFIDAIDAISSLAGVSFNSNGGLGSKKTVYIRGIDSTRLLILVDGIRLNDPANTQDGSPLHHIMMENIERIEVLKGAQSGVWGADATGGVVNIITKKNKLGTNFSFYSEYGSFNTRKFGMNLGYNNEIIDLSASYDFVKSDSFSAYAAYGTNIDNYEDDAYENQTYGINLAYKIDDNNKIKTSYTKINSFVNTDSSSSDSLRTYDYDTQLINTSYNFKSKNYESDVYYNYSFFDRNYDKVGSNNYYESDVHELGQKSRLDYYKDSYLVFGADFKRFNVNKPVDNNYKNLGFFANNTNRFSNLVFTQALRYDDYSDFENKLTGKLGVKYFFTNDLDISVNASSGYNVPTMNQLYGTSGNANLNPESTTSYDVNLRYKDIKFSAYNSIIEDMLAYDFGTKTYTNFSGENTFKGFEISYQKAIETDTILSLSYDRVIAKNSDSEYIRRIPFDTLKMSLDYYGIKNFHFNLNGEYVGKRYNSDDKSGRQTGKYTLWNTVVNYDINKNFKAYFKIDNILDKYYQTVDNYATSPRAFYIGIKASF